MSQKVEFVEKATVRGANISALCREFGISRQTGHKWIRRYRAGGHLALSEQSRRPASSPLTTAEDVVVAILEHRERHPTWGPQVIARVLGRAIGDGAPSASTIARVLRRLGKVKKRRPPVRVWSVEGRPRVEVGGPNDLWTIDFKGWWRAANGDKCEPLTVRDAYSRKVLAVNLVVSTRATHVRCVLERLFKLHGLPAAMQSDNGSPFVAVRARGGLTRLSVWLASLGIRLVRSRPASPQDNGGHERMHRDLSELQLTPAPSRRSQQRVCDQWLVDFNHVRPHQALGGRTPEEVYTDSPRRDLTPRIPAYPSGWLTRRVNSTGEVHLHGDEVFVSRALSGQLVGLKQETELRWSVRFFEMDLGTIEVLPTAEGLFARAQVVETVATVAGPVAKRQRAVA